MSQQPAYVPPPPAQPPAPPRKPKVWPWVAGGLAALALLGLGGTALALGLSGATVDTAATRPALLPTETTAPAVSQVECVNIRRAYNAWDTYDRPHSADDIAGMNDVRIGWAMEAGKTFVDAVSGYDSQPSKNLAVAVADYNYRLAVVNAQVTLDGAADDKDVQAVGDALDAIDSAYQSWQSATCS